LALNFLFVVGAGWRSGGGRHFLKAKQGMDKVTFTISVHEEPGGFTLNKSI